ncbi:MAG: 50S ribosomal protein L29 [Candidatus Aenigmatarchaeota archaeon]|nr:50S ribosomal protein L29 [Candidatus Aenigmarchaeota archaeon]
MAVIRRRAVHELDEGELVKRLAEIRLELAKERAHSAIGAAPKNPGRVRELRRAIARILTEITKRRTK